MIYGIYRTGTLFLFCIGVLGWGTVHAAEKNKKKEQKPTPLIASVNPEKKEIATNWELDSFIASNFTVFKENLPLKSAEKILEFLSNNGLNPQISIAPEIEGKERQPGEDPTYDILIPLSEQTALTNLLAVELEKKKEQKKQMSYDITPSARGCCQKKHGFILSTEFLYWKITEDNLLYGQRTPGGYPFTSDTQAEGKVAFNMIEQPFEWDPGVRVGVGYNLPYYGWDVDLKWTWIQSKPKFFMTEPGFGITSQLIMAGPAGGLFSNLTFDNFFLADSLQANWHLVFNSLDLVVGRSLFLSRKLSIRPNGGLKTAWIRQKIGWALHNVPDSDRFTNNMISPVQNKNDFWGIGPRFGLDTRYVLPLNFGLFAETAAALLYGKFEMHGHYLRESTFVHVGGPIDVVDYAVEFNDTQHRLSPWLQIQLGLDWALCFGKNRNITFRAGYECQIFWAQFRSTNDVLVQGPKGNLMMNGLTLQGKFEF